MIKLSEAKQRAREAVGVFRPPGELTEEQRKIRDLEAELMAERARANAAVHHYNVLLRRVSEAVNHLAGPQQATQTPAQKPQKANDG